MKARERILQILSNSVTPALQQAGFRKSVLDYHRKQGEVIQTIQFQLSASNFYDRGYFNVNVGLCFDPVSRLENKPVVDMPKEFQCHYRRRLNELIRGVPDRWDVSDEVDDAEVAAALQSAVTRLLELLAGIDSVKGFLALGWLKEGADLGLRAQMYYLQGDTAAALRDLRAPFFRSRPNWDLDSWLEQRGLSALKAAIHQADE